MFFENLTEPNCMNDLEKEIKEMINKCWEIALKDPFPEKQSLIEDVYSS